MLGSFDHYLCPSILYHLQYPLGSQSGGHAPGRVPPGRGSQTAAALAVEQAEKARLAELKRLAILEQESARREREREKREAAEREIREEKRRLDKVGFCLG